MILARRSLLLAAVFATTVAAQDPAATPAPSSRPVEVTLPVAPMYPPVADDVAPRRTFKLVGEGPARGFANAEDDAVTIASRKLAALFDGARLESEIVEATGVSRRIAGAVAKSLLRARVTASRSGLTTVLNAPEAGVEITVKDTGPAKVRRLTAEECEETVRRTEVSVDNASSSLPPAARGAFRDWWRSKLQAIDAASAALKTALEKSPESAAPTPARTGSVASRNRTTAPRSPRNRTTATSESGAAPRIDRTDVAPRSFGSPPVNGAPESVEGASPPIPPSAPEGRELVESPRVRDPLSTADAFERRLPDARAYEALVRRRDETPDAPIDAQEFLLEFGLAPDTAAELERRFYLDDLARARSDALLGPDRSARLNQALDHARARAVFPGGVEVLRGDTAIDGGDRVFVITDSRPGVEDYRRAVDSEVRSAAGQARKLAEEMRAEAARRNVELERSMRVEFESAREAEQEALREHRKALDEFRRAREAQVQSLRTELEQLRKELDALRTDRAKADGASKKDADKAPKNESRKEPSKKQAPASEGGR